MKIIVPVKYVPDATGDRFFAADGTVARAETDGLLSELDEYAVEQALQIGADTDAEVIALTIGPDDAAAAIKRALQMGCTAGIHVSDDDIHGTDAIGTSTILSRAVTKAAPNLVICGMASTDGSMGVIPAMLAEQLGWPAATFAAQVTLNGDTVRIERDSDTQTLTVEATLPAVISVTDQSGEARYPSMKGILAAKKKPVTDWDLADLDLSADDVGLDAAWSSVTDATPRPPRATGKIITDDDGSGVTALAEFLTTHRYV